jgi:formylglycine-generating enzyme required for sulfatase activity
MKPTLILLLTTLTLSPQEAPGVRRVNPKDGLTYVWIPPGHFTMGCSRGDNQCWEDEKPTKQVHIAKGFWMSQTEVTQSAYQRVTGKNPSHFQGPNRPVEMVDWNHAKVYCEAAGMRLPKEAEWEYAARAGSKGPRYGNLDEIAWYAKNSGSQTHDVAQKKPNAWGLYDMLGNVFEWTQEQKLCGGSWLADAWVARVSYRNSVEPTEREGSYGFRCAGDLTDYRGLPSIDMR